MFTVLKEINKKFFHIQVVPLTAFNAQKKYTNCVFSIIYRKENQNSRKLSTLMSIAIKYQHQIFYLNNIRLYISYFLYSKAVYAKE